MNGRSSPWGPLAGVHNDALIVGGGTNVAEPAWENEKIWRDTAWVLTRAKQRRFDWHGAFNFSVLVVYLLSMVGVGAYFAWKSKHSLGRRNRLLWHRPTSSVIMR